MAPPLEEVLEQCVSEKNRKISKVYNCPSCDFSSGYRGMDGCSCCQTTGSVFYADDGKTFPNTKEGYIEVLRYILR